MAGAEVSRLDRLSKYYLVNTRSAEERGRAERVGVSLEVAKANVININLRANLIFDPNGMFALVSVSTRTV